jgi:hypothetical protein
MGQGYQSPRILVNGSPRTGTTWMLNMVASIPGHQAVGNFDRKIERYAGMRPGEVVHGHDWYKNGLVELIAKHNIKVILMIRDPRDQLVSRMFHVKRSARHRWHERFQSMSNHDALILCIEGSDDLPGIAAMVNLTRSWIDGRAPMICMRYEELLGNPVYHFGRVLSYLNIEDAGLCRSIVQRNRFERYTVGRRIWQRPRRPGEEDSSSHVRKGIVGDWKNHLETEHRRRVKELIGGDLIALEYEQNLDW